MTTKFLGIIALMAVAIGVKAQKLNIVKESSSIEIFGTSSLHDWEESVTDFNGSATLAEGAVTVKLVAKTESIESGKSIMDSKTHEALKSEDFPEITFEAKNLKLENGSLTGTGTLTLAGVSKPITVKADGIKSGDQLKVSGSVEFLMSTFGIEPPTAMFGQLITGDKVTIKYAFELN